MIRKNEFFDQFKSEPSAAHVILLPVNWLQDYSRHPYVIRDDVEMDALSNSIQTFGVLQPIIVRQLQNVERTYEIISGHRRVRAALRAGLSVVPAYVLPLSDEDAAVIAVTSNLQRSRILPSEKARSLCLLSEALRNRAGTTQRNPDNAGEDRTAQRYMKLVDLIPELLEMVDAGRIAFSVGVELSFLKMSEQNYLLECIGEYDCTPSYSQAVRLRRESCAGTITPETIRDLLSQRKPNQRERIRLDFEKYVRFFPGGYSKMQIEKDILQGLELLRIRREKARTNR